MPMTCAVQVVMSWNVIDVIAMRHVSARMVIKMRCVVISWCPVIREGTWVVASHAVATVADTDTTVTTANSNTDPATITTVAIAASVTATVATVAAMLSAGD